jgi:hypothetical protein
MTNRVLFASSFILRPRHGWFSHADKEADSGWIGPHRSIEEAAQACFDQDPDLKRCYVAQGRKLRKAEIEEMGVEYAYEVDTRQTIEITLPNP